MSSWLARALIGAGLWMLRALPRRWREAFASFIGWLAWTLNIRRAVALDNISHALPELSGAEQRRMARAAYGSMARAMLDSVTSDLLSDAEVKELIVVDDWKGLDVLVEQRRPVLIASGHLGSWELFAEVMARRGFVFSAVVRPLAGAFNEWLIRSRAKAGLELILQRGALRNMLAALERGRSVVQVIDQALPTSEAVWVPFFGRLASTTPALSAAAIRSGVPVYVVVAVREGDRLRMRVEGPVPVPTGLDRRATLQAHAAAVTALFERQVRLNPEQWLWLHRRWKKER